MTKARNKAYRPKLALIPMMREKRDEIARVIGFAVEAYLSAPSSETFDVVTRWMMTLTIAVDQASPVPINRRQDQAALSLILANEVCQAIEDRNDRTGKYGFSGDDARDLRAAVSVLEDHLRRIPFNVWLAAVKVEEGIWREILAQNARALALQAGELLKASESLEAEARAEGERVADLVAA